MGRFGNYCTVSNFTQLVLSYAQLLHLMEFHELNVGQSLLWIISNSKEIFCGSITYLVILSLNKLKQPKKKKKNKEQKQSGSPLC